MSKRLRFKGRTYSLETNHRGEVVMSCYETGAMRWFDSESQFKAWHSASNR